MVMQFDRNRNACVKKKNPEKYPSDPPASYAVFTVKFRKMLD